MSQKTLILMVHIRLPPTNIPVTERVSYSAARGTLFDRSEHIALWDTERSFEYQYMCGVFVKKVLGNSNMCFSLQ